MAYPPQLSPSSPLPPIDKNGLIGWWPFIGGTPADFSGCQSNGVITGAPTTKLGLFGPEMQFNGSAYVGVPTTVPKFSQIQSTTATWSWLVNTTQSASNNPCMVSMADGSPSSNGIICFINTSGILNFSIKAGSTGLGAPAGPSIQLNDGRTHHVMLVIDVAGGYAQCMVDGVFGTSVSLSAFTFGAGDWFFMGVSSDGFWGKFTGSLGDVRVYNRRFSPGEMTALANSYVASRPYFNLQELPVVYSTGPGIVESLALADVVTMTPVYTGSQRVLVLPPGTTSWVVPSDWNNSANSIAGVGGGGGGGADSSNGGAGGGGGGAYAVAKNVALTPGVTVPIQIGTGGATNVAGSDTIFNTSSPVMVAKAGTAGASGKVAGVGGAAASCTPSTGAFSGGNGGSSTTGIPLGGTGGGGAGGPNGAGAAGGQNSGTDGGGGGASDGGGNGVSGGAGGTAHDGTAGGAFGGGAGSHGSGGGGGSGGSPAGGVGGAGVDWVSSIGSIVAGPGGAGGGAHNSGVGGAAGLYGGGGGGSSSNSGLAGGAGAAGVIIIIYSSSSGVSRSERRGYGALTNTSPPPLFGVSRSERRGYGALTNSVHVQLSGMSRAGRRGEGALTNVPHILLAGVSRSGRRSNAALVDRIPLAARGRSGRRGFGALAINSISPPGPQLLPSLAGLGWSFHKKPRFNTVVSQHPSGADVRTALWIHPIYEFEATYDGLGGDAVNYLGLGANSLQTLMGFCLTLRGMWGQFLYVDVDDDFVSGQNLGTGDGTTTQFTFTRPMGVYVEPVGWVTTLSNVYLGGIKQTTGFSVITPNILSFATAPLASVSVTADFAYAFLCRMDDDGLDFEEFMSKLHTVKSFKFRSLRLL